MGLFPLEVMLHALLDETREVYELVKFEVLVDYFFKLSSTVLITGFLWVV
jgi:hypothetical protein